jgi:peptide/nickel transport system permease protein
VKNFLIKRLAITLVLLVLIVSATFFIVNLAPGDPTRLYLNPEVPPSVYDNLKKAYGLDKPLFLRYFLFIKEAFLGNLGFSFSYHQKVINVLLDTLPNTIILSSFALFIEYFFGILLGITIALINKNAVRLLYHFFSLLFYAIPSFWLGLVFIFIFSYKLKILPPSHMYDIGSEGSILNILKHLILPGFALGLSSLFATSRFVFKTYEDVLKEQFILNQKLLGVSKREIYFKYALKNSLIPIITLFGLSFPFLVSGALLTEVIFSWPGMGRLTYNAILSRDYPLIIGASILSSFMVLVGNLLADILYFIVDPRIRYEKL